MTFKLRETLYYYDEPLLAVFEGYDNSRYLGVKTIEIDGWENPYLLTPLSDENYTRIVANHLKLRDAFLLGDSWTLWDWSDGKDVKIEILEYNEAEEHFPGDGYLRP